MTKAEELIESHLNEAYSTHRTLMKELDAQKYSAIDIVSTVAQWLDKEAAEEYDRALGDVADELFNMAASMRRDLPRSHR